MEIVKFSKVINPSPFDIVVDLYEDGMDVHDFVAHKNNILIKSASSGTVTLEQFLASLKDYLDDGGKIWVNDLEVDIKKVCSLRK